MPVRKLSVMVVAVSAVLVGVVPPAGAEAPGSITGAVTDVDGAPLAGVVVGAQSIGFGSSESAKTATDGTFRLDGLEPGRYQVCFDPSEASGGSSTTGYVERCWKDVDAFQGVPRADPTPVTVPAGGVAEGVVQALAPEGAISGLVTDRKGNPLPGAKVTASIRSIPAVVATARTDTQGRYAISGLRPDAHYSVCASGAVKGGISPVGYLDACYGGAAPKQGSEPASSDAPTFEVAGGVVTAVEPVVLDAAARLEGTLTDANGRPIAGVTAQGTSVDRSMTLNSLGVTDSRGHYVLSLGGDGSGNDRYFGTRLPSVAYRISFDTRSAPAFVSGLYRGVPSYDGRSWGTKQPTPVTPTPGRVTRADDTLVRAAVISGVVTDGRGTALLPQVSLLRDGDYLAYADAEAGRYEFGRLPAGSYDVCFDAEYLTGPAVAGYLDSCREGIAVAQGQRRADVDHALTPAAGIRGRVLDASGRPVAGVNVRLTQGGSTISTHGTNADGAYSFIRLRPGDYQVCFVTYAPEWRRCYGGAPDAATATSVTAYGGRFTDQIDAQITDSPDTVAPTVAMSSPTAVVQTGSTIRLGVSTADEGPGVASYDVRYRYADWRSQRFSTYRSPESWQYRTGAAPTQVGTSGRTYCYSVRARDRVGNLSAYSTESCATIPLDDRSLKVASGTWTRTTSAAALHRTVSRTSTYGGSLSLADASVSRAGLVVTTCPGCGTVGVYVDGRLLATRSTWSRTVGSQQLVLPPTFELGSHVVTVKLLQRGRSLIVDGLALSRG